MSGGPNGEGLAVSETDDIPVEVTLVDGSRWIIYYRLGTGSGYAHAMTYLKRDISEACLMPADDLDRVQRRHSLINMAYVVSVREPDPMS